MTLENVSTLCVTDILVTFLSMGHLVALTLILMTGYARKAKIRFEEPLYVMTDADCANLMFISVLSAFLTNTYEEERMRTNKGERKNKSRMYSYTYITFHYSNGWTNGKRSTSSMLEEVVNSASKNAGQSDNVLVNCELQKLKLLLQGNIINPVSVS
ncbi:Pro-corazonin [Melipona quadrifasciata]|uniref:Pro-corazonin n=1 Tax=Melipona quadrifasciata TaxID=166423 RepID=A0A0M8ZQT0_9HYME|nr:Pro-corazonin [Melipona quadrifasciata]